jgi:hypothetical protein
MAFLTGENPEGGFCSNGGDNLHSERSAYLLALRSKGLVAYRSVSESGQK